MSAHTQSLEALIDALSRLPGVGRKSATRMAFYLLRQPAETAHALGAAIVAARDTIRYCEVCQNLCESSPCERCRGRVREESLLCVVEFHGRFHVLHGVISPLDGVTPADLKIHELIVRLSGGAFGEVILAMNPSIEGEATASYLTKLIAPLGVKVSRIASGLPMGAQLEFADKATLGRSLIDRRTLA